MLKLPQLGNSLHEASLYEPDNIQWGFYSERRKSCAGFIFLQLAGERGTVWVVLSGLIWGREIGAGMKLILTGNYPPGAVNGKNPFISNLIHRTWIWRDRMTYFCICNKIDIIFTLLILIIVIIYYILTLEHTSTRPKPLDKPPPLFAEGPMEKSAGPSLFCLSKRPYHFLRLHPVCYDWTIRT